MSQIYKSMGGGGPISPTIPTQFNTQNGNAVPAANILIVNGVDSSENNDNGIITKGGVVGTGTANEVDVVITNRIVVTLTTSDIIGQNRSIIVLSPTNGTAIEFSASFIGYDSINNEAAGGRQEGIARKSGGLVVVVGTNDSLDESDPALAAVDWVIESSGVGNLLATFTGIAGRTINWKCLFTYIQV